MRDKIDSGINPESADEITKLYIEPSSLCNLACTMCSRLDWQDEDTGHMTPGIFAACMAQTADLPSLQTIFFGGIGEPLGHPEIAGMIRSAKTRAGQVELVTNGTLLDDRMIQQLLGSGLDRIWISVDSLDEQTYQGIRKGAQFQHVTNQIRQLARAIRTAKSRLEIGLAFVLMRRNLADLARLQDFARRYRIKAIKVTHIIPYNQKMAEESLFERSLDLELGTQGPQDRLEIDMPVLDMTEETTPLYYQLFRSDANILRLGAPLGRKSGSCRFIEDGYAFVRWDGEVSPCLALLHESKTFLHGHERNLRPASFGNIQDKAIGQIWHSPDYSAFRARVRTFDFSPCVSCGGCEKMESNQEDCFGNQFPVCGGCLWAQGFIQCP